ncbi:MAG: hypothetical protein AAB778_04070 [Patescibacteria group bacterium]
MSHQQPNMELRENILSALSEKPLHLEALAQRLGIVDDDSDEYRKLREEVSSMQVKSKNIRPILKNATADLDGKPVYPIYIASEEEKLVREGKLSDEIETDLTRFAGDSGFSLDGLLNLFSGKGRDRK